MASATPQERPQTRDVLQEREGTGREPDDVLARATAP